jgi:hypothetical protein
VPADVRDAVAPVGPQRRGGPLAPGEDGVGTPRRADHREEIAQQQLARSAEIKQLLDLNTELTKKVDQLTAEIHKVTCVQPPHPT